MFGHFYNKSIRSVVVAFGSLFNNIVINKRDSNETIIEYIRVPLSYGGREKFIERIESSSSISEGNKVEITLPRLGFEVSDISYDPTRKRVTTGKKFGRTPENQASSTYMYTEVPYDVSFSLSAYARNMDDLLQIIEQITPFFTPEFSVSMNFNDINQKTDVPFLLNSVSINEDYEGSFDTRRLLTADMNFTAKTYIFGPQKTSSQILNTKTVIFNYGDVDISFGATGSPRTGSTGAYSRVDVGVSGGVTLGTFDFDGPTFDVQSEVYVRGAIGSTAGPPIDTFGNTI